MALSRTDLIPGLNQAQGIGSASPAGVAPGGSPVASNASISAGSGSPATASSTSAPPPGSDIATRMNELMRKDSPLMRQARTSGLQSVNRRGLANSSMGIGAAEAAALGVVAPIASQESQQDHNSGINESQLAAAERERQAALYAQLQGNYGSALTNTLANHEIPADARAAVQASLRDQFTGGLEFLQNLYGVRYGPPSTPPATGIGSGYSFDPSQFPVFA